MDIEDKIDYCLDEKKLLSYEEGIELVKKECSEIINIYKKAGRVLFRGTRGDRAKQVDEEGRISKVVPRKRRNPKDTDKETQKILDNLFNQRFGWKPRSQGIFAAGIESARYYGTPHGFFPVNGFEYVWSPNIDDLYNDFVTEYEGEYDIKNVPGMWVNVDDPKEKYRTPYDLDINPEDLIKGNVFDYKTIEVAHYTKDDKKIKVKLKWVPDVTEDQWFEQQEDKRIDIINSYTNKNLASGIRNALPSKEFTFKSDLCYLILLKEGHYSFPPKLKDFGIL